MWHEARKHERKLRGMMVDYKKRAERRREYYEKIVSNWLLVWGGRSPAGWGPGHPGKIWLWKYAKIRAQFPQDYIQSSVYALVKTCPILFIRAKSSLVWPQHRAGVRRKVCVVLTAVRISHWPALECSVSVLQLYSQCSQRSSAVLEVWLGTLQECHQYASNER